MGVTAFFSKFIAEARFEDLPFGVIEKAKDLILDTIGCAFGGYLTAADHPLIEFVKALRCRRDSTIIGEGCKAPCSLAAGVNAQLANLIDFDETYRNRAHPGSSIVQSALAVAEYQGASGKELINAVVLGYEIATRIGDATHPSSELMKKVWIQNWPVFGVVAAAAKLLDLNEEGIRQAFGIAGGIAPSVNVHRILDVPGAMIKQPNFWFCEIGINSVFLALKGFTGYHDYLDGEKGYWVTVSDKCDWEAMMARLSKEYNLEKFMALKYWSTCRWIHPGIELVLDIIGREGIKVENIEEIVFKAHWKVCASPYNNQQPKNMWDAYWSVPWAIAMAILGYKPGPEWYAKERFTDTKVLEITRKIKLMPDPEASEIFEKTPEKTFAKIELKAGGKTYTGKKEYCKGDPQRPLTKEELNEKFKSMANPVIGEKRAENLAKNIEKLEQIRDVREITKLFHRI
ncbi:MAG: MmgE/PrpD family protein [Candidatus Bathyarchaeia archaeon]